MSEDRAVQEMTRELDAFASEPVVAPPAGFADRVMAAVADEPLPQPVRAFGLALAAGHIRAAASSVGDAWRVALGGFAPAAVRAQALALVLLVAVASIGVGGGATVGALGLLTPQATPAPTRPAPSAQPTPSVSPSPEPTVTPETTPSPDATATDDHGGRPTETPDSHTAGPTATGTDDHGGNSGPGGGGGSGSGSGSGKSGSGSDGTATPTPTGTDDHGGGGDG